ncbi:conjugal transfer protein TraC [Notoacmeibacter marinus]|uniref:conjugal transfer protein TraC n=1 Tax=Notoacmeibacter marinus TaxID=1876515 RepID=UPI000DF37B87|nr:conjugal transfer protein TraC [Notoacmeibacter marinus]
MRKPSSKIKEDIARLQEQLKVAETREAERIGRLALKAGLGEIEIDDAKLVEAFEDLAKRFRAGGSDTRKPHSAQNPAGASSGANNEA